MKIKDLIEDRLSPKKPRKGSLAWEIQQQRKEYDKKHPPVEPSDNMVGNAKIKKVVESIKFGADTNEFKNKKEKLVKTEHKVGDEVMCDEGHGSSKYGKVHRLGRTMVHVKHNDGAISAYAPEHVEKYSKTYWQDKQGKRNES